LIELFQNLVTESHKFKRRNKSRNKWCSCSVRFQTWIKKVCLLCYYLSYPGILIKFNVCRRKQSHTVY